MDLKNETIVVTGGAGFIGTNVVNALNSAGYSHIYIVDNLNKEAKKKHLELLTYERYFDKKEFIEQLPTLKGITLFIHLGACTDTTVFDEEYFKENNIEYSKKIFEYCLRNNSRMIYASSAATYGAGEKGFDDTERDLKPLNPYGYSKYAFDEFVLDSVEKPSQWVGLKFFNVYGPYEDHKGKMASMIAQGFEKIKQTGRMALFKSYKSDYSDGGQKRDFIYVKDIVDVIMFFVEHPTKSGIFNLGTGKARTFFDLSKAIFIAMNLEPAIDFVEMPEEIRDKYQYFTEANMDKLHSAGYVKKFTELEDGIKEYVQKYLNVA